jgi:transposase InsO family protein
LFGHTRQAYYQWIKSTERELLQELIILERISAIRKKMKRISVRKVQHILNEKLTKQGQHLGRDALYDLMRRNGMLVRRRKRKFITTLSNHWLFKYKNLINNGFEASAPHQLWVSDITYLETDETVCYLYLITDAYSRKIVGYHLSRDLKAVSAVQALKMAFQQLPVHYQLIHHSDRGVQYCSEEYVSLLKAKTIAISMSAAGEVLENSMAERVNGILKDEWIHDEHYVSFIQAQQRIKKIIALYNQERPHLSVDMMTPDQAHRKTGKINKLWKNYYKPKAA